MRVQQTIGQHVRGTIPCPVFWTVLKTENAARFLDKTLSSRTGSNNKVRLTAHDCDQRQKSGTKYTGTNYTVPAYVVYLLV